MPLANTAAFVCPVCGYRGPAKRKAKGSLLVVLFLLLLMVLPAIIYMIVYQGYIYVCPKCGLKVGDAT